jgi:hypothetical protein
MIPRSATVFYKHSNARGEEEGVYFGKEKAD